MTAKHCGWRAARHGVPMHGRACAWGQVARSPARPTHPDPVRPQASCRPAGQSNATLPQHPQSPRCQCRPTTRHDSVGPTGSRLRAHASMDVPKAQVDPEYIAARIAANRQRREARVFLKCPACQIGVASPGAMHRHMLNCCADLLDQEEWNKMLAGLPDGPGAAAPPGHPPLEALLSAASAREVDSNHATVLHWAFRSGERDSQGQLIRHGVDTVAARMGLPVPRTKRLLSAAMRAVPLVADDLPLHVLHECEHFLGVYKPTGVQTAPVHRFRGGSMVNRVVHRFKGATPHVLHRLDMHTSGVLLFAKTPAVVAAVHLQFRRRTVRKMYMCVGQGCPDLNAWESRGCIGPHPRVKVARLVGSPTAAAEAAAAAGSTSGSGDQDEEEEEDAAARQAWQTAHTSFAVLARNPGAVHHEARPGEVYTGPAAGTEGATGACLLAAAPHSGRTHQIRVHAAAAGHPLLGDELYGLQGPWIQRQALHSARLQITHPLTKQPLTITAPLPDDLRALLTHVGLPGPSLTNTTHQGAWEDTLLEQAWHQLHGQS